ncbi:cation antiporter [Ignisphaera aggregans DSM 17230]|uniref:Cation antiporter n=1 Tax=Ignisphaera aggregans (strain DSM 17230 / JCM 13409 / AQ1.S1) TaxID=583356 RepID=E0ST37_IGNAA|nr:cation antiporter [Ignisphaera aggregans DSM 17230]
MVQRIYRSIPIIILTFIVYIVFSGSISIFDLITGGIVSILVGIVFANITLSQPSKVFDVRRWIWAFLYAIYYFFVAEVKAHIDVIKRILHPQMPINPGIVKIPINVETDYALTAVANSITNTPGTVVVDVDKDKKYFYVHWIDVTTTDMEKAYKEISYSFEKYAKKIFD